jgi:hypothetical protein
MPSKSGCGRTSSTVFQPMCGSVGAPVQADRSSRQKPERLGVALVAALEEELVAQADPKARPIGPNPFAQRLEQAALAQVGHRRAAAPTPGTTIASTPWSPAASVRHDHASAGGNERLADADHVRRAVVEHGNDRRRRRAGHQPSDPFVEATPLRRGSIAQAARSDRPRLP